MGRPTTWDRCAWVVTPASGERFHIETEGGATWALRALIAAGSEGLRPTDGATNRFGHLIERLRGLGVRIEDLPPDEVERPGFRLACAITSAGSR